MSETVPTPASIETVDWTDPRAVTLREAMDAEIGPRYADRVASADPSYAVTIARALSVDPATIHVTILAVIGGRPVGHAALRDLGADFAGSLEVKRVYVAPEARRLGVSRQLMLELERRASLAHADRLILQTGDRQPEAVALYERLGYTPIPIYPPYLPVTFSRCFEKEIHQ